MKVKKKNIIIILSILFIALLAGGINLSLYQPTSINRFISSKLYKSPANTAFVDQNFYNCLIDNYNRSRTTKVAYTEKLTDEQLQGMMYVSCEGQNQLPEYKIQDLTGIEKLSNLQVLNLRGNAIESVDLSNNTKIYDLFISDNKISSINLLNNTELVRLELNNNLLSTIDLSNNTKIKSLHITNNNLIELDLSNNTKIENLYIDRNEISTIDISNLKELESFSISANKLQNLNLENNLKLYRLLAGQNNLKNINLEKNTNLEYINLSNNYLSKIDITNNSELTYLNAGNDRYYTDNDTKRNTIEYIDLSNNPLLEHVNLENLKLKKIDLSNNPKITTGYFNTNNLEEIILNDSISSSNLMSWFWGQNINQKKIVLETGKSIIPDKDVMLYLEDKIISSSEFEVETFIDKLGLTGLSAKIYDEDDVEITTGKIANDYFLRIYDDETLINAGTIFIINSSVFKDPTLYQCVIEGYNLATGSTLTTNANLTTEELLKITEMDCFYYSPKDFTGLEQLHNLETLKFVGEKNLKSIDLSNMKNLKSLELRNTNLEKIDLTNNKELSYLNLNGNNLSEINLSQNTKLTKLYLEHNYLTEVDVRNNTALTDIKISSNGIKVIDLSNNVLLENLNLDNNNLEEIDISSNTKLKFVSIQNIPITESFYAEKEHLEAENKLSSINLANNKSLMSIGLNGNQLTEIDLSNNKDVYSLTLENNKLTEIDLSNNTNISTLNLRKNSLTIINLMTLTKLYKLDIRENNISELNISNSPNIRYLYASNNDISEVDLKSNLELNSIYLADNKLTTIDISGQSKLKELVLSNNNISALDVSSNIDLTDLDVNNNKLSAIDTSNNTELITVKLNNNNLTEIAIDNNKKIENLYLNDNALTSFYFPNNTALEILELENNQLTVLDLSQNINLGAYSRPLKINGNPFKTETLFALTQTNVEIESPIILPEGKSNTVKKIVSGDTGIVSNENIITPTKAGDYDISVIFCHNIGTGYNSAGVSNEEDRIYTLTYKVKVLEVKSDKYAINGRYGYIFTNTDTDEETILNNITLNDGTKEIIDNYLVIKYNDEIIHKYAIVNISSAVYDMSKENIYTAGAKFDETKVSVTNGNLSYVFDSSITLRYNNYNIKTYNLMSITSEKYKMTEEYIYVGTEKYDAEVINNIKAENVAISISNKELVVKFRGTEIDRISLFAIDFGELPVGNNKVVLTSAIEYSELISNITTMGVTYKIFAGETEITSGDITEGMTIKVYYNDTELDTYELTNEYLDLSKLNVDEKNTLVKGLQLGSTVENIKELILTSGTITFYNKNNEVLSDTSKVTTGSKIVIELATTTYTYILSVKGDVTGTGESNVADVAKLYQYMKNKIDMEYCYVEAGNVIGDTVEIKVNDVAKLYQYIKGKIDSLEA